MKSRTQLLCKSQLLLRPTRSSVEPGGEGRLFRLYSKVSTVMPDARIDSQTNIVSCLKEPEEEMLGIVRNIDIATISRYARCSLAHSAVLNEGDRDIGIIGSEILDVR